MSEMTSNEVRNADYQIKIGKRSINVIHVCYWFFVYIVIKQLGLQITDILYTASQHPPGLFLKSLLPYYLPNWIENIIISFLGLLLAIFLCPIIIKRKTISTVLNIFINIYIIALSSAIFINVFVQILYGSSIMEVLFHAVGHKLLIIVLVIPMLLYNRQTALYNKLTRWQSAFIILIIYAISLTIGLKADYVNSNWVVPFILDVLLIIIITIYLVNIAYVLFTNRSIKSLNKNIAIILIITTVILNFAYKCMVYYDWIYTIYYRSDLLKKYDIFFFILDFPNHYYIILTLFTILYIQATKNAENKKFD